MDKRPHPKPSPDEEGGVNTVNLLCGWDIFRFSGIWSNGMMFFMPLVNKKRKKIGINTI
ncbi:hypothetical protein [Prevotella fusca]